MSRILDPEVLADRAQNLGVLNGIRLLFVELAPAIAPDHAILDLEFHNGNALADIVNDVAAATLSPTDVFSITGGSRIRAGTGSNQVQVTDVQAGPGNVLRLRVEPIGDYSTYTLRAQYTDAGGDPRIDPLLDSIGFKFRPGCFNLNCRPSWEKSPPPPSRPQIDYLARDFDSFKHLLINAMRERVPRWAPTSEVDLDQVILDLIAAEGDELADFQDRVFGEAYLARARKRVSLARHARLMDYHIHQGNQASTLLAVQVPAALTLAEGFGVWTGDSWKNPGAVIFASGHAQDCDPLLNTLDLYNWDGAVTALEIGSVEADIALPAPLNPGAAADADSLRDLLRGDAVRYLVLEEKLNPETGTVNGRDPTARRLLELLEGDAGADSLFDPLAGAWFVRVRWRPEDALNRRFCFVCDCAGQPPIEGVSAFHGNIVAASHGRPHRTIFRPPGAELAPTDPNLLLHTGEAHFEPTRWGALCALPNVPLAYLETPPGGEKVTRTTLTVDVAGFADPWLEQSDLIESEGDDEHFIVETDEYAVSRIRFGNGANGRPLAEDAVVTARYQVGGGSAGNVGCDSLTGFDPAVANLGAVWNPFDVTNGRDPEPVEEILRRVPVAYRARQLRAVTLEDYVRRAEELPGVAHAQAAYRWTGSWRTVRIAIDPLGGTELTETLRLQIEAHLEAVRLIGEDLEIRPARYLPLDIKLTLCAHADYWPEDLAAELEMEFSDGYLPDGRQGLFHPDRWSFGQPLYASQLIGRALSVQGVDRVLTVSIRRWQLGAGPTTSIVTLDPDDLPEAAVARLEVDTAEIILVANDPNHLERGRILFEIKGGRR